MATPRERLEELRALEAQQATQIAPTEQPIQQPIVQPTQQVVQPPVQPTTDRARLEELRALETQEPTVLGDIGSAAKAGTQILTGAAGQVAGGLTGLVASPLGFVPGLEGIGAKTSESVSKFFTELAPEDDRSKEFLETIGTGVEKVTEAVNFPISGITGLLEVVTGQGLEKAVNVTRAVQEKGISKVLGDSVMEATNSPLLATIAETSPTALVEVFGAKGIKAPVKNKLPANVGEAIKAAAPDVQTLKVKSRDLFKQVDEIGTQISPKVYDRFVDNLESKLLKAGLKTKPSLLELNKKSAPVLEVFKDGKGTSKTFADLKDLRDVAKAAANTIDANDARLGKLIIRELDDGIEKISNQFARAGVNAGEQLKNANELWRRARSAELIQDMIEDASLSASGLENGLRVGARQILKNKKKSKFLKGDERAALRQIVQGTGAANAAKILGKFGISEGQATSMLGASIGIAGGAAIGGPAGALSFAALGQRAKKAAQKLTVKNAKYADELIRAGDNAGEIAATYLKNTPVAQRRVSELTELLSDPSVNLDLIKTISKKNKLFKDALFFAQEARRKAQNIVSGAAIISPTLETENE